MQLVSSIANGYHHVAGTCVQDKHEYTKDTVRIYRQVARKVSIDPTQPHLTHFDPENGAHKFFWVAGIHIHNYTMSQPQLNISWTTNTVKTLNVSILLGCDAMLWGKQFTVFHRIIMTLPSRSDSPRRIGQLGPDTEGTLNIWNMMTHSPRCCVTFQKNLIPCKNAMTSNLIQPENL